MADPWFLLYGGTSVDGRGPGEYVGRTTDKQKAIKRFREVRKSPYSVGYVEIITDRSVTRAFQERDFEVPQ